MHTRTRLTIVAGLCLSPLAPLSIKLFKLQVMDHRTLSQKANGEFDRLARESSPRASILDRHGNILAHSVPAWTCFIDRRMVRQPRALSQQLGPLLDLPPAEILRHLDLDSPRFISLRKRLDFGSAERVARAKLQGVGLNADYERFYPNGGLAQNVLGQVSPQQKGLSGVELASETLLAGEPRRWKIIRDGAGKSIYRSPEKTAPLPPPLKLTLDRNIQFHAEETLSEALLSLKMSAGSIAVQDPSSGEILAMASYPPNPLKNPLVQDAFEPGSTFKIVTAVAALEEGAVSLTELFDTEDGQYQIAPGVVIRDHEPQEALNLSGILEHSSNIGIAKIAQRLGPSRFYRYYRAFGFLNKTGISLPGETRGNNKEPSQFDGITLAAASYGYGVGASPLQILNAYSAVANGGTLWEPRILHGAPSVSIRRVASPRTMALLSEMLEATVERGTASTAKIFGYRVAGKTGTVRRLDFATKKYSKTQYTASFVGFLPVSRPLWTVLVVIEEPQGAYYGSQVAAPLFARLGSRLLALKGIPPDRPLAAAHASQPR